MGYSKSVLKGKFIAIQPFFKKQEKPQINNLTYHLKELEREAQTKHRVSSREIIKIREEINKIEIKNYNRNDQENQELVL